MSQSTNSRQNGFTIIEITIAMAFIATLLISVMLVGMQLMTLYNKGVTIRDVNAVIRHTVRDMQDSIAGTKSQLKIVKEDGQPVGTLAEASAEGLDYYNGSDGGRLCTGVYTYIWNYGGSFNRYQTKPSERNPDGSLDNIQYVEHSPGNREAVRFVKIEDPQKVLCKENTSPGANTQNIGKRVPTQFNGAMQPVFGEGERQLVLYAFDIASPADLQYQRSDEEITTNYYSNFYTLDLTIGSSVFNDEYQLAVKNSQCKPPADSKDVTAEYCAINSIEFVARTGQF